MPKLSSMEYLTSSNQTHHRLCLLEPQQDPPIPVHCQQHLTTQIAQCTLTTLNKEATPKTICQGLNPTCVIGWFNTDSNPRLKIHLTVEAEAQEALEEVEAEVIHLQASTPQKTNICANFWQACMVTDSKESYPKFIPAIEPTHVASF